MEQLSAISKSVPYSVKVYEQLKQLIITNTILPGQALSERELAATLGVSRTPIRDALRLLEQEGWVSQSGARNKVVSLLTRKNLRELMEIRAPLELMAYDLAIQRITKQDIDQLENILHEMEQMGQNKNVEFYALMQRDTDFHVYFANISQNSRVIEILYELRDQIIRTSMLSLRYGNLQITDYAPRHYAIIQCLRDGEYEKGRLELCHHLEVWKEHLSAIPQGADDDQVIF